jgi:radical SAM modification target selenobiotic family peptide
LVQQKDQPWCNRKNSLYCATGPEIIYLVPCVFLPEESFCEAYNPNKEGKMEKKYLKKVLTGLSIAGLVTGISGMALSASG